MFTVSASASSLYGRHLLPYMDGMVFLIWTEQPSLYGRNGLSYRIAVAFVMGIWKMPPRQPFYGRRDGVCVFVLMEVEASPWSWLNHRLVRDAGASLAVIRLPPWPEWEGGQEGGSAVLLLQLFP